MSRLLLIAVLTVLLAPVASAQPRFTPVPGTVNPLGTISFEGPGFISLADLDGDGRLDLVTSYAREYTPDLPGAPFLVHRGAEALGGGLGFRPFERLGAFDTLPGAGQNSIAPTFGDLDGDGDLDMIVATVGVGNGLAAYRNVGTVQAPRFERFAPDPLAGIAPAVPPVPTLVDIDSDGRLDLVLARVAETSPLTVATTYTLARNVGSASAPAFAADVAGPFAGIRIDQPALTPSFLDIDGDGDLDAALATETMTALVNTGSASAPAFRLATAAENPFGEWFGSGVGTAAADLDGDGLTDLAVVTYTDIAYTAAFIRTATGFDLRVTLGNPLAVASIAGEQGNFGALSFADVDGDGDLDLLGPGRFGGELALGLNTGTATRPDFRSLDEALPTDLPGDAELSGKLVDLDGDGRADLVVLILGDSGPGEVRTYRNVGTGSQVAFARLDGAANPFAAFATADLLDMTFGDLDGDGDLDAVLSLFDFDTGTGQFVYARNVGTAAAARFAEAPLALPTLDTNRAAWVALGDIDRDGRLDLVAGEVNFSTEGAFPARLRTFYGSGTATAPAFTEALGTANPFGSVAATFPGAVALGDVDGDGDLDLALETGIEFDEDGFPISGARIELLLNDGGITAGETGAETSRSLALRHVGSNPARGQMRISMTGTEARGTEARTVEVFDATGRRVARVEDAPGEVAFDVAAWAPGVYLVRASAGGQQATLPVTVVR